jgi:hypothetical protein
MFIHECARMGMGVCKVRKTLSYRLYNYQRLAYNEAHLKEI